MAVLRARVRGKEVTIELTIDELQELLTRQVFPTRRSTRSRETALNLQGEGAETSAQASDDLVAAIRKAWPSGVALVDEPELTTGNVRRFLIQRVLAGEHTTSTGDVAHRFFGRALSPSDPDDAVSLRRLWYCIRGAKRDVEEAVGGRWIDATDVPVRLGTSKAWKLIRPAESDGTIQTLAYREGR